MGIRGTWFAAPDEAMNEIWSFEASAPSRNPFEKWWRGPEPQRALVNREAVESWIVAAPSLELEFLGHELVSLLVGAPLAAVTPPSDTNAVVPPTASERLYRVPPDALAHLANDERSTDAWVTEYRAAIDRCAHPIEGSHVINGFVVASLRAIARNANANGTSMYGWER